MAIDLVNPSAKATAVSRPLPLPSATTAGRLRDNSPLAALRVDFDADGVDPGHQLFHRQRTPIGQHVTRQLFGAGAAAFQRHQQPGLHLRLGAGDLGFGQGLDRVVDDIDDHFHHLRRVGGIGAGIEPEKAGVGIGRMEGVDRVAQPALLAHFLEQPRRHPAAERVGEDLQLEQRQVGLRHALQRQRQMRLLEFAMHHAGAALAEHRRLAVSAPASPSKLAKRCVTSSTTRL